jgi:RND family efflux transporter MFP subunit
MGEMEMKLEEEEQNIQTVGETKPSGPEKQRSSSRLGAWMLLLVMAAVLAYVIVAGLNSRAKASTELKRETDELAIPTVAVVHPGISSAAEQIVLPGNMQAFTDTPIWARASGYLTHWYVDIGARVTKGQLLAELEAPEVDRQLQQAQADLNTAQANYGLAESTAKRWQVLLQTDSVSKQETDEKVSDLAARKATMDAAGQNVRRLQEIQSFQKIYAPFSGIITARNVDVGSLIDAGANTPGREIFHEAAIDILRVYVSVPQVYSQAARAGVNADLTLVEHPGRTFHGVLVRTANAIDITSRTLNVEVDVNNPTGELLPGAYVSVRLKIPSKTKPLTIPSNALLFRSEGTQVALVRDGRTQLVHVTIGRDYGNEIEIASGITSADSVIVNPSDSISSNQQVRIAGESVKSEGGQSAGGH